MSIRRNEAYLQTREGVDVVRFEAFDRFPELTAFFSTRRGGVSSAPFDSLNLGLTTDDDPEQVLENRRRFFRSTGVKEETVVFQRQVHGDRCVYVDTPGILEQTDACFTDRPGVFLAVSAADCVPVFVYEPVRSVCGVIHAGWRGTSKNITGKAVQKISQRFGLASGDMIAVLGPSVSSDHYEVSEEVASKFDPSCLNRLEGKPHVDLWKANRIQLEKAGVRTVHVSGFCTYQDDGLFFSHRRSAGRTGRMLGLIGISD